ncbi:MAG: alpha/beta hydrolase [SAR86 cluster bacterium]|uniref:Alpha/beta hydrolase n=1 Tax=SAR86 cluster bacterium TaxID=2030880 RepID=A0A2A5B047_9GAMM|nr:MAG: alpha/beta hydrolase [SAR86 cluster bacterium]
MLLNYRQYSKKGTPLLILHGLFGSLSNWGWHSKQLAEHFAVYGVDLRNHGDSFHDGELNYQLMANDVRQLMGSLKIESCYMIGHSMGGKVAMQLALNHPDLIEKLIVVDIAPVAYSVESGGHVNVMAGMNSLNFELIRNRADAEEKLGKFIQDESTRKFILTNLKRNENGRYQWRLNLPAIEDHYDELRGNLSIDSTFSKPVLFVKGALSDYIQAQYEKEILRLFPAARVKIIMQAGHWLHAEKPQAFQKVAMNFLQEAV